MKLERAINVDITEIMQLYQSLRDTPGWNDIPDYIEDYPSIKDVENDIKNKELYCLKNENKKIIALCTLSSKSEYNNLECWSDKVSKWSDIMRVAVSKDYQRKGIGKLLIGYIIEEAKKLKYEGIRLVTAKNNDAAIALYTKIGFKYKGQVLEYGIICNTYELIFNLERLNYMNNKTDMTVNTYNNIVEEYIDYFNSKDLHGNVQFQREINLIVDHLENNAKVLDVGTAIGDYPKYLTEKVNKNFEVIGIDASTNMIKVAKRKAPKAKFYEMDIRNICFEKSYFDCIICFATLIHINDTDCLNVLNNFDYILKENGLIAINVMEYIDGEKEFIEKEPFNPKYKTYFNKYTKDFFIEYFTAKNYQVLVTFDNPIFNSENVKEPSLDTNQFSIIVQKK